MKTKKTVLYIEDEPDIRMLTKMSLELSNEYAVIESSSGHEGLEHLERFLPDLILLDLMMPDMDGLAVLASIKSMANTRSIPVIFLTGKSEESEIQALKDHGAAGVISKPFDPVTLSDKVSQIWEGIYG